MNANGVTNQYITQRMSLKILLIQFWGKNKMGIEEKLKNAKTATWLTDGLSERELMFIKLKSRIYIVWGIVCIHAQKLFRK